MRDFGSSWRNTETGEWVISLFSDNAVYDNKVYYFTGIEILTAKV